MREVPTLWMPSDGSLLSLSFALLLRRTLGGRPLTVSSCCCELKDTRPLIVVLPRLDLDLCCRLRTSGGSLLVLAAALDEHEARHALAADLEGVLDVEAVADELPRAIDALAVGERWLSPSLACRLGVALEPVAC